MNISANFYVYRMISTVFDHSHCLYNLEAVYFYSFFKQCIDTWNDQYFCNFRHLCEYSSYSRAQSCSWESNFWYCPQEQALAWRIVGSYQWLFSSYVQKFKIYIWPPASHNIRCTTPLAHTLEERVTSAHKKIDIGRF